jgi:ribosomal protein S7
MLKQFYSGNIDSNYDLLRNKLLQRANSSLPTLINFSLTEKVAGFDKSSAVQSKTIKLALFNSIAKRLVKSGKSQLARTILNNVLAGLKKKGFQKPLGFIYDCLIFLKPIFNILNYKRGRKVISIPFFLNEKTEIGVVIRWIILSASKRLEKGTVNKLISEFTEIYQQKSLLIQKKMELIKHVKSSTKNLRLLRTRSRRRKFFSLSKSK